MPNHQLALHGDLTGSDLAIENSSDDGRRSAQNNFDVDAEMTMVASEPENLPPHNFDPTGDG